jgi:outer membrane murein-binding lipoprotein Lpp
MLQFVRWAILAGLLGLAGCASTPAPINQLDQAEQALAAARQARAAEYAPVDWRLASDTFSQAQALLGERKHGDAARLLERVVVHAELARARAENSQQRAQIDAQQQENERLRRELLGDRR